MEIEARRVREWAGLRAVFSDCVCWLLPLESICAPGVLESDKQNGSLLAVGFLNRHRPNFFFHFNYIDHHDRVPGAAVEECAVGAFAEALLAADTQDGIDCDAAKRRGVFVRHPEHAV